MLLCLRVFATRTIGGGGARDPRRTTTTPALRVPHLYTSFSFFLLVVVESWQWQGWRGPHASTVRGHVNTRRVDGFRLWGPPVTGPYRDDGRDAMGWLRCGDPVCLVAPICVFDAGVQGRFRAEKIGLNSSTTWALKNKISSYKWDFFYRNICFVRLYKTRNAFE